MMVYTIDEELYNMRRENPRGWLDDEKCQELLKKRQKGNTSKFISLKESRKDEIRKSFPLGKNAIYIVCCHCAQPLPFDQHMICEDCVEMYYRERFEGDPDRGEWLRRFSPSLKRCS